MLSKKASEELPLIPQWMLNKSPVGDAAGGSRPLPSPSVGPSQHERPWVADRWSSAHDKDIAEGPKSSNIDKWAQDERRWKEDERGDTRPQLATGARRDAGARWGKPASFENGWPPGEAPARDSFSADRWSALESTPPAREPAVKERWRDDRWGTAAKPTLEPRTWTTSGEEHRNDGRDPRGAAPEARTPGEAVPRQESGRWRSPGETRGEDRTTPLVLPGKHHRGFGFGRGRGHGGGSYAPGAGGGGEGWERGGGGGGNEAPGASAFSSAARQPVAAFKRHGQLYTITHLQDIMVLMQAKLRAELPLPRGLKAPDLGPLLKGTPDEDEHVPEPAQTMATAASEAPASATPATAAAAGAGPEAGAPGQAAGSAGQVAGFGSRFIPPSTDAALEQQGQGQLAQPQAAQAQALGSDAAAVLPHDLAPALQQLAGLGIGAPQQQQQQQQLQAPAPSQIPDAWVYQDPQGNVQGPFTKADIMEWLEGGYFTLNLPIKPATESADRGWVPLHAMLQVWQSHHPAPPGFAGAMQPAQQLGSAASMLSHASSGIPDSAAALAGHGSIGLDPAQQQLLGNAASMGSHGMPHSVLGDPLALMQQQQQQQHLGGMAGMGQPQPLGQHQMHPGAPGGMGLGLGQPFASTSMGMPASEQPLQHAPWGPAPQQMLRPPQLPGHLMPQLSASSSGFVPGMFDPRGPGAQQQPFNQAPTSLQQQHLAQQHAHAQQQQMAMQQQQQQQAELERQQQAQQQQQHPPQQQPQQQRPPERNVLDLIFPNHAQPPASAQAASPWAKAHEPVLPPAQDEAAARPRLFARGAQQAATAAAPQQPQQEQQAADGSGWEVVGARPHKAPQADEPPAQQPRKAAAAAPIEQPAASNADNGSMSVPSGPMTVPLLPQRQAEPPKAAPWAATSQAPPAAGGKSLRQIQEEEQARAAAEAARQRAAAEAAAAAAAAAPSAAPVGPWGRVASGAAAGGAAPPGQWGSGPLVATPAAVAPPLRDILSEEQQRVASAPRTASLEPRPSGKKATLGDVIAMKLEGPAASSGSSAGPIAWASAGARGGVTSLKQVMMEETVADLEGGAVDEDGIEELLFPLQQRHLQQQQAAQQREREQQAREQQAAAAAELRAKVERERSRIAEQAAPRQQREEEGLFWDYGGPAAQPAPAPARSAAPAPAPARAAAANGGGWAARVAVNTPAAAARAAPAQQPQQQRAAPARSAYSAAAAPVAAPAPAPAAAPAPRGGSGLFMGSLELSQDFATWCRSQMFAFNGNDDLTLIEFLWGIDSNSEVAEYCQELWGNRPGVSGFVAEFIKRKAAEQKGTSGRRKKKPAAAAATAAAAPSASISSAAVGLVSSGPGSDAWSKIPKKPATKKKGGKKLDASELGFTSKLPIALLESDE